jgi:thiol-disulfide isomerase/thioredoxin
MRSFSFLVLVLLLACSCTGPQNKGSADIIITGRVTGIPDGKIFLVDAKKWRSALDSATVRNGSFEFRIKPDSSFIPFRAALHYWNNDDSIKPIRLQYGNHLLNENPAPQTDVFYLEKGETVISGTQPLLSIRGGKETELLFQNQFTDIGWMGDRDPAERNKKMNRLEDAIKQHPSSFFLLESIYENRVLYSKAELKALVSLFTSDVQISSAGKKYSDSFSLRPDAGLAYPNLRLLSAEGNRRNIIDSTGKLNMLVFWASWCSPCIKEIPQLKALDEKYSAGGLKIVSISIDLDTADWLRALKRYRLNWPQVIIDREMIQTVEDIFSFTTIPFLVFTDNKGNELARFSDYDEANTQRYEAVIKKYIR